MKTYTVTVTFDVDEDWGEDAPNEMRDIIHVALNRVGDTGFRVGHAELVTGGSTDHHRLHAEDGSIPCSCGARFDDVDQHNEHREAIALADGHIHGDTT